MRDDVPDLLERWARGWALARELTVRDVEHGLRIDVNATSRRYEFFLPRPTAVGIAAVATQLARRPDGWLTLNGDAAREHESATAGLSVVTAVEALMARPLEPMDDHGGALVETEDGRARARIEIDDRVAAAGVVALRGGDAVFDRIETTPGFRRRGLGSAIMNALSGWAFEHGARTGILAASAEGQLLYGRLGWTIACPLVSFRGTAADSHRATIRP